MRAKAVFVVSVAILVLASAVTARLAIGQADSDPPDPPVPLENPRIPPDPFSGVGPLVIPSERADPSSLTKQVVSSPTELVASILPKSASGDTPHTRFSDAKQYMLRFINAQRRMAGAPEVSLGDNNAAQIHAENSMRDCVVGHWGTDGLTPSMRYSLAGGYQSNRENVSGYKYCLSEEERPSNRPIKSVRDELGQTMAGYMDSPGHRENILYPWHRKVNLGLSWDTHQMWDVQHFEGDYADCSVPPTIQGTTLHVSCTVDEVLPSRSLAQVVYYDSPPHALTQGQIARSYSYGRGRTAAFLRQRAAAGLSYPVNEEIWSHDSGCTPYDIDPSEPAPSSPAEAHALFNLAKLCERREETITVPWIDGEETINGRAFALSHDIGPVLREHGAGVYTLVVWGCSVPDSIDNPCEDENSMAILKHSIFYGIDPPGTYTPTQASPSTPTPVPTPTPTATPTPAAAPSISAPRIDCGPAVADKSNTGLVADCEFLLGMKSALRGSVKLNWWSGRSIEKWDGIKVQGGRVVEVSLPNRKLDGVIPVGLGNLSALKTLDLSSNSLTGQIPASLNSLTNLTRWRLAGNSFTGCLPAKLAQVSDNDAASLGLPTCGGSGPAPTPTPTPLPTDEAAWEDAHCTQDDIHAFDGAYVFDEAFGPFDWDTNGRGWAESYTTFWNKAESFVICQTVVYDNWDSAFLDFDYNAMRRMMEIGSDVVLERKIRKPGDIGERFRASHIELGAFNLDGTYSREQTVMVGMFRRSGIVVTIAEVETVRPLTSPPSVGRIATAAASIDRRLAAAVSTGEFFDPKSLKGLEKDAPPMQRYLDLAAPPSGE